MSHVNCNEAFGTVMKYSKPLFLAMTLVCMNTATRCNLTLCDVPACTLKLTHTHTSIPLEQQECDLSLILQIGIRTLKLHACFDLIRSVTLDLLLASGAVSVGSVPLGQSKP